jgi:hypothetical protein
MIYPVAFLIILFYTSMGFTPLVKEKMNKNHFFAVLTLAFLSSYAKAIGNTYKKLKPIMEISSFILLLLVAFLLGYIASYITNYQIQEYCFYYNLYNQQNIVSNITIQIP